MTTPEFQEFPKMPRLSREIIVTEKIDGTNAQVFITEEGEIFAGSRSRWLTLKDDNFGFAKWVEGNKSELLKLGAGRHFGEWWGSGIQRGYGLPKGEKRFSLFNTIRFCRHNEEPKEITTGDVRIVKIQQRLPEICHLVPQLYRGEFDIMAIDNILLNLKTHGSHANIGFMKPEGVVVFHIAGNLGFKKTIEKDEVPKTLQHS